MTSAFFWKAIGTAACAVGLVGVANAADEETAPYEVKEKARKFEIREYPELMVASTSSKAGDSREADRRFMKLFRYISGGNEAGEKIAMTTPVFMSASDEKETMSFVMPAAVSERGAPAPEAGDVAVESMAAKTYAVFRFRGLRSAKNEAEALKSIQGWISQRNLKASGEPVFAYYNPPWIPGFLRRNEILVPISDPPSE